MKREFEERMRSLAGINDKDIDKIFLEIGYSEGNELTLQGAYRLACEFGITLGEVADRYLHESSPRWVATRIHNDIKENNADDILRLFAEGLIFRYDGRLLPIAIGTNKVIKDEVISEKDHAKMINMFIQKGMIREIYNYMYSSDICSRFTEIGPNKR